VDRGNRKKLTFGWKIFFLIISIPVFILITEAILTIFPVNTSFQNRFFLVNRALDYPEVFKKDHDLFWRFRPDQTITSHFFENKTYTINSLGLRGKEIEPKSSRTRIIALGNSCTFGWGVEYSKIYSQQLERLINSDSALPEVEVINAGIPGYSSYQGRKFFESNLLKLKPDMVLIMFAWNDQWAAADNIPDKNQEMPPEYIINVQNLFSRLKIYRLIKKLTLSAVEKPLESKLIKEKPVYRVSESDFYDNLHGIVETCRENGIMPILLTSPIPSLEKYYPPGSRSLMHEYHKYYNNETKLLAKNTGTYLVDVAGDFNDYSDLFDDASYDPIHFNARGHLVAAEEIYAFLRLHPAILRTSKK